jgi:hypothetical protein
LPQLPGSESRSTQLPPHFVSPRAQLSVWQLPELQRAPWPQPVQPPQCWGSCDGSTQTKPSGVLQRVPVGASQATSQLPLWQIGPPVPEPETGSAQTLSQAPQFELSLVVSVHAPLHCS